MALGHTQTLICPTHWAAKDPTLSYLPHPLGSQRLYPLPSAPPTGLPQTLPSPTLFPLLPEFEIMSCFLDTPGCLPPPGFCLVGPRWIFLSTFIHVLQEARMP